MISFLLVIVTALARLMVPEDIHTPRHIMPLGDSITFGANSAVGGYRGPLANALPGTTFIGSMDNAGRHEGHPMWTIADLDKHMAEFVAHTKPDVILLDAGTNDDFQSRTGDQMISDMGRLLDTIYRVSPGTRVYVAQITITTDNTPVQQVEELRFDNGLPALVVSKPWAVVVDMRQVPLGKDGRHPTEAGYTMMALRWIESMKRKGDIK